MMTHRLILCGLAALQLLIFSGRGLAQQPTGSITGTVTDTSGAVIPDADVTVNNAAGLVNAAKTDQEGVYTVEGLAPGTYKISISVKGFEDFVSNDIKVEANQAARLDPVLKPASSTTSIKVAAGKAAAIETSTAQISGKITEKEITEIGLNGRNFTQLITLAPGVSNQTGQDEALVGVKGSVKYSVNGGRVEYNTFDVDGSDVLNAGINGSQSTLIVFPSLDAINELKVLTSNYGAIYGRSASGTVLVATKSGTSQFHGDAYEFVRNEHFNARNFFDQTYGAPLYRRNDFGFTLGGPIFIPHRYNTNKERTFFFYSEEVRREKTPQDFTQGVPSIAERNGDFTDVCPFANPIGEQVFFKRQAYPDCPGQSSSTVGYLVTYPGNRVPVDPNAAILLKTGNIPLPNSTVGCNSSIGSCFVTVVSPPTHWREELFRIDHEIRSNLRATFRYIHDAWDTVTATPQWGFLQNNFPTVENTFIGPGVSLVARASNVIAPTLVNEVAVSYTTDHISLADFNGPGGQWQRPAGLTVGYLFNNGFGGKVPGIAIRGTNAEYGGFGFAVDPSFQPYHHTNPTFTIRDDVGKVKGNHTLGFGVHLVFAEKNENNPPGGANTGDLQGILTFGSTSGFTGTGNAFADFLMGRGRTFQQDDTNRKYYDRYWTAEPYFQDDWRFSSRLTVNLGVRVAVFGDWHEKFLNAYNWVPSAYDPSQALGVDKANGFLVDPATQNPILLDPNNLDPRVLDGIVQCGKNGVPASCSTHPKGFGGTFNPAPRLGFAWDPRGDGKTSIRGGYGVFFHHGTGNEANTGSLEGSAPLVLDMKQNYFNSFSQIGAVPGVTGTPAFPLNVTAIPEKTPWTYVQQWSISVQRELPRATVATFAYVGSKGTHLTAERQLNQLPPVDPALNPFQPGQPLTLTDCNGGGAGFNLDNGATVAPGQPGFVNLTAACASAGIEFADVNTLRQFAPGLGEIYSLENVANSRYNAFQATVRRAAGPLNLSLSYTYGRSVDDASDRFDTTLVNSFDLRSNFGPSNFDQRHLLNIGYVYELPSLESVLRSLYHFPEIGQDNARRYQPSRFTNKFLVGWELSGVTTFQSGTPFSIINGGSGATGLSALDNAGVANSTGAGSYPDIIRNPADRPSQPGPNPRSFGPLLGNPSIFTAPEGLTFGSAGRNYFHNPNRTNFDVSLLKHFQLKENVNLELRGEAFNVFNHTELRIYNPDFGNTANNTINCYGGPSNSPGYIDPKPNGVNCVLGSAFLHPVDAHRPRTIQFGVKVIF